MKAGGLRSPARTAVLESKRMPLGGEKGEATSAWPHNPPTGDPRKTKPRYLCRREAPRASSRRPAFCRGYWGKGAPCSDAVESVGAHLGWAPGCSGFPAGCCPRAEGGRLAPWSNPASQRCSHRMPLGRRALWMRQRTINYSVRPEPCSHHLCKHLPSQVRSQTKDCGQHQAIREEQRSSTLRCCRLIS